LIGTIGVTISWLCVCSNEAPAARADVLENHSVDKPRILLEIDEPIAVDPNTSRSSSSASSEC